MADIKTIGDIDSTMSFPFNAELDHETGEPDRLYDSIDWRDYFSKFISDGVYPKPSNGLKVESLYSSFALTIRMGSAFIQGATYFQKTDFSFPISPPHLTLGRVDSVVIRLDNINRYILAVYVEGEFSISPTRPALVRTDDIFDILIAEITVKPNAQEITQANILDTRLDIEVCGISHALIDQVDTSSLFNQYDTFLKEKIIEWEAIQSTKQTEYNQLFKDLRDLYLAIETQTFLLIHNNFDDTSKFRGTTTTITSSLNSSGNNLITETMKTVALTQTIAIRTTEQFANDGYILAKTQFYPWSVTEGNVTYKTTNFLLTERTDFMIDNKIIRGVS